MVSCRRIPRLQIRIILRSHQKYSSHSMTIHVQTTHQIWRINYSTADHHCSRHTVLCHLSLTGHWVPLVLVLNLMTVTRNCLHFVVHCFRRLIFSLHRVVITFKRTMTESFVVVFKAGGYAVYVLFLLLAAYLLNQLDRYALAVSSQPMAHDIKFGDKGCLPYNSTFSHDYKKFCVKSIEDSSQPERNKTV